MNDVSILIRSIGYSSYLSRTIDSILKTARGNYEIIVAPRQMSAASNSNNLMSLANNDTVILMDEDLEFIDHGWDIEMINTLNREDKWGVVAPQILDRNGRKIGPKHIEGQITVGGEMWGAILCFNKQDGVRYDENYIKTIFDDTDFLYQYLKSGRLLVSNGSVKVKHMRPCSRDSRPDWFKINMHYFNEKWRKKGTPPWGKPTYI